MEKKPDVFASWVETRPGAAKKLSARSVLLYRQRWEAFERWLSGEGKSLPSASPADLQAFLYSRVRRAANGKQASVLTTSRYLSDLHHVYRHGMLMGFFENNPAAGVVLPFEVRPNGLVLPMPWLLAITDDINLSPQSFTELRNALLVQLCAVEAFSVADLCALQLADAHCIVPATGPAHGVQVQLQLNGRRLAQRRARLLYGDSALLLYKWIQILPTLPGYRLSQALLRSLPTKKNLTPKTVYEVCADHVRRTLQRLQVPQLPYHLGPNVLRNTCIVAWLNDGASPEDVCAKVGISAPSQLNRLSHAVNAY